MRWLSSVLVFALATAASADVITLKSGRVITGTFVGGTARQVQVEVAGKVETIDVADIHGIEFSANAAADSGQSAPRTAPVAAPASTPPAPSVRAEAPQSLSPALEAPLPTDPGVYAKRQGQWIEVAPEVVYWKTPGKVPSMVGHHDVTGQVAAPSSRASFAGPPKLLVVVAEGGALTEYRLLRLHPTKDDREFRMAKGGQMHDFRDVLTFDSKKVFSNVFEVSFPATAGPGEYGLLPSGATNGNGKIFSFSVAQ
jgi:hypothetical protein